MRTYGIVLAGLLMISPAAMGAISVQSPFFNFAGSGVVDENSDGFSHGWSPTNMGNGSGNAPYRWRYDRADNNTVYTEMTYTETWAEAQVLGTILLVSPLDQSRNSVGNMYVATVANPQPSDWVLVDSFDLLTNSWALFDINRTNVYGVKIEVTGGDTQVPIDHLNYAYQIGSIGFFAERMTDVAFGKPTIASDGVTSKGNMTAWRLVNDNNNATGRFFGNGPDQYVGVDFQGGVQLQGLLVDTCSYSGYEFGHFDVQVYRNGGWVSLGTAIQPTGDDMIWIDFGPGGEYAEQVRLFGDASGPHGGRIINGIMAFAVVPEPATMSLLALGGLALLRRRVR